MKIFDTGGKRLQLRSIHTVRKRQRQNDLMTMLQ